MLIINSCVIIRLMGLPPGLSDYISPNTNLSRHEAKLRLETFVSGHDARGEHFKYNWSTGASVIIVLPYDMGQYFAKIRKKSRIFEQQL